MKGKKTNAPTHVGNFIDAIDVYVRSRNLELRVRKELNEDAIKEKRFDSEEHQDYLKRSAAAVRENELEIAKAILETAQEIILNRKEYPLDPKYFLPFGERDDWKGVAK